MNKIDDPKKQSIIALKKARSSIDKILVMIEEDKYCVDVLTQILAVNGLVKSASDSIFKNHLRTCFKEGMQNSDENHKEQLIKEVIDVLNLSSKK